MLWVSSVCRPDPGALLPASAFCRSRDIYAQLVSCPHLFPDSTLVMKMLPSLLVEYTV